MLHLTKLVQVVQFFRAIPIHSHHHHSPNQWPSNHISRRGNIPGKTLSQLNCTCNFWCCSSNFCVAQAIFLLLKQFFLLLKQFILLLKQLFCVAQATQKIAWSIKIYWATVLLSCVARKNCQCTRAFIQFCDCDLWSHCDKILHSGCQRVIKTKLTLL